MSQQEQKYFRYEDACILIEHIHHISLTEKTSVKKVLGSFLLIILAILYYGLCNVLGDFSPKDIIFLVVTGLCALIAPFYPITSVIVYDRNNKNKILYKKEAVIIDSAKRQALKKQCFKINKLILNADKDTDTDVDTEDSSSEIISEPRDPAPASDIVDLTPPKPTDHAEIDINFKQAKNIVKMLLIGGGIAICTIGYFVYVDIDERNNTLSLEKFVSESRRPNESSRVSVNTDKPSTYSTSVGTTKKAMQHLASEGIIKKYDSSGKMSPIFQHYALYESGKESINDFAYIPAILDKAYPWKDVPQSIVEAFLKEGAKVDAKGENGNTALHLASTWGKTDLCRYLVSQEADIMSRNDWKDTPLHKAANLDRIDTCDFLLEQGADINAQNRSKSTPLHTAAFWGEVSTCRHLMNKGANPHIKNWSGETGLEAMQSAQEIDKAVDEAFKPLERAIDNMFK